jgi:indolepyruvate ferredoxin oxidoreductase beta subunit
VISTETHGMAMRGGSVISQIKIGDYQSPLIRCGEANILLGTSASEVQRNLPFLRKGGTVIMNAKGRGNRCVDATGIAQSLGNPRSANLVLLGYALARLTPALSPEPFLEVIKALSPEKVLLVNAKAFEEGWRSTPKVDEKGKKGKRKGRHG